MKEILSILVIGVGSLLGLIWLSWRASQTKTSQHEAKQAQKTTDIVQQAAQVAANSCNTDRDLEEALKNGTF